MPKDDEFPFFCFETRKMALLFSDLCSFSLLVWEWSAGQLLQLSCTPDNNVVVIDSQQQFVELETLGDKK